MNWLELHTLALGMSVYVNMSRVAEFREKLYGVDFKERGTTLAYADSNDFIDVLETPEQILALIARNAVTSV